MMSVVFEQQKRQRLHAIFTFRIVEAIKRVRMEPASPMKGLPLGLSLATGVIIAVLSIGMHLNPMDKIGSMSGSPLPGESKVLKVGEIPVDIMKTSNISVLSNQQWKGTGLGSIVPSLQNALLMAPQAEGETWTKKADMPTARMNFSTSVANGKIYAIGGLTAPNEDNCATVEEYNPETDTWVKKSDMPTAIFGHSSSEVDGIIYVIGGGEDDGTNFPAAVKEYNPMTDKWTKKADMPTPRSFLSTCSVNGKIYAIGGWTWKQEEGAKVYSTVEEYDPVTDKWTKKADMPTPRSDFSTSALNGRIYAIGNGNATKIVEEYNPETNTWARKSDAPTSLWTYTCTVKNKIYAIGNWNVDRPGSLVEEYDPTTDKWTKCADIPTARSVFCVSVVNGRIYAIGGSIAKKDEWGKEVSIVEEYDPGTSSQSINLKGKLPTTWGDVRTVMNK